MITKGLGLSGGSATSKLWVSFFIGLFYLYWNFNYPMMADDLCIGAQAALHNGRLFELSKVEYLKWRGRISAILLDHLFFTKNFDMVTIPLFNILNALIGVLFYSQTYKLIRAQLPNSPSYSASSYLIFSSILTIFLWNVGFLREALWKAGAIQYFWGITALLWLANQLREKNSMNAYLFFACGLFLGLCNELFFASVLSILVLMFVFWKDYVLHALQFKKLISCFVGMFVGFVFVVIAPGNYVRRVAIEQDILSKYPNKDFTIISKVEDFFYSVFHLKRFRLALIIFVCSVLVSYLLKKKSDWLLSTKAIVFKLLLICGLFCTFLPVAYLGFSDRMLMLFMVVVFLVSYPPFQVVFDSFRQNRWWWGISFATFLGLFTYLSYKYKILDDKFEYRRNEIALFRSEKIEAPHFNPIELDSTYDFLVHLEDMVEDTKDWKNSCFADYYDFREVRLRAVGSK